MKLSLKAILTSLVAVLLLLTATGSYAQGNKSVGSSETSISHDPFNLGSQTHLAVDRGYRYTFAGVVAGIILLLTIITILASVMMKVLSKQSPKGLDVQKTVRILRLSRNIMLVSIVVGLGPLVYSLDDPDLYDSRGYNMLWPTRSIAFCTRNRAWHLGDKG